MGSENKREVVRQFLSPVFDGAEKMLISYAEAADVVARETDGESRVKARKQAFEARRQARNMPN